MKEAKLATVGVLYRRQFTFADIDLTLHDVHPVDQPYDSVAMSNPIFEKVFLPIDPDTAFVAYFGHLVGYDAGYYGYAWADAIAADMATVFEKAPNGFLDKTAGMKVAQRNLRARRFARHRHLDPQFSRARALDPAVPENVRHRDAGQSQSGGTRTKRSRRRQAADKTIAARLSRRRLSGIGQPGEGAFRCR